VSILKSEQRDERKFWRWVAGLFGAKCRSYLIGYPWGTERRDCKLAAGHAKKHTDGSGIHWGYGENWLDGN
jgi:hypothetical protein